MVGSRARGRRTVELDRVLCTWQSPLGVLWHTLGVDEINDVAVVRALGDIE